MTHVGVPGDPTALIPGSPEARRQVREHRAQVERERELREERQSDEARRRVMADPIYRLHLIVPRLEALADRLEAAADAAFPPKG